MKLIDNGISRFVHYLMKRARIHPLMVQEWMERSGIRPDEDLASYEQAYRSIGTVFTCTSAIASAAASVPLKFYQVPAGKTEKEKEELDYQHPLVKLWRTVNVFDTQYDFCEAMYSFLVLTGNFPILQEPKQAKEPKELWPLSPHRVSIVPRKTEDAQKLIAHYAYTNDYGQSVPLLAEDVLHLKLFNPYNDWYGQGCISAARNAITTDDLALRYNKNLVRNMARPDGILTSDQPNPPPKTEIDRIKKDWMEKHGGAENAGNIAIMFGGLKWQDIGMSPRDMQWYLGRKFSREEQLMIFNIPPVMAGLLEGVNFATAAIQKRIFWENAVIPKHTKVAAKITQWLQPRWGEDKLAAYDYADVAALAEDKVKKAGVWVSLCGGPIARVNEGRAAFGLDPAGGLADSIMVSSATIPLEGTGAKEPRSLLSGEEKRARLIENEARTLQWRKWDAELIPWRKKWDKAMRAYFTQLEKKLTGALRVRASAWELVEEALDDQKEMAALRALADPLLNDVVDSQGKKAIAALGIEASFDVGNPEVQTWIKKKKFKFADDIHKTTKEKLRTVLLKAEAEAATLATVEEQVAAIKQGLEHVFTVRRHNAMNIATTEVNSAANAGTKAAWKESEVVEGKEWLTSRDADVRDIHEAMDGEVVPLDRAFSNGLDYPGDPAGEAEDICNCRCTMLPKIMQKALVNVLAQEVEHALYPGREGSKRYA